MDFNTLGAVLIVYDRLLFSLSFSGFSLSATLSSAYCSGEKGGAHISEAASFLRISKRLNDCKPMKRSHRSLILNCVLRRNHMQNTSAQGVKNKIFWLSNFCRFQIDWHFYNANNWLSLMADLKTKWSLEVEHNTTFQFAARRLSKKLVSSVILNSHNIP